MRRRFPPVPGVAAFLLLPGVAFFTDFGVAAAGVEAVFFGVALAGVAFPGVAFCTATLPGVALPVGVFLWAAFPGVALLGVAFPGVALLPLLGVLEGVALVEGVAFCLCLTNSSRRPTPKSSSLSLSLSESASTAFTSSDSFVSVAFRMWGRLVSSGSALYSGNAME